MDGRPRVVQHPEDRTERLRVLVGAPRFEERAGVLVVLKLGLTLVVGRARRRAGTRRERVRVDGEVVEDALRFPGVVVPDGTDRPEICRTNELLQALQRWRRLGALLGGGAESA